MKRLLCWLWLGLLSLCAANLSAEQPLPVRGLCIAAPSTNRLDEFIKFIEEELAPRLANTLVLRVDYNFQFQSRPEMSDPAGLSRESAQRIAAACRQHHIRVIPLIDLLGHQSWQLRAGKLLK